jgi:TetR/AcrR family transcriptional repressor of lmrAB and yxaGH operons
VNSDSRERMVRSAASLISSRGVSATSFTEVLSDSAAPRGSIYHHFPDGKDQLAAEAMRWASERVLAHLRAGPVGTPSEVLGRFINMWRNVVLASNGASGCVVAGVAVDVNAGESGLIDVVRATFRSWVALLGDQLEAAGISRERAGSIALATLAAMEGALILCRAEGGVGPLDAVAAELLQLLPAARSRKKANVSRSPRG